MEAIEIQDPQYSESPNTRRLRQFRNLKKNRNNHIRQFARIPAGAICFPGGTVIDFAAAERFRMLRAKIERLNFDEHRYQVIGISSALPQEGKSMIAVNLARSLASGGTGKTILLDCDLRRPTIHEFFGLSRGPGVSDLITCQNLLTLPIHTMEPGLDVITAGTPFVNCHELFRQPECSRYLAFLKRTYRYIILDLPPVLFCSEPIGITLLADSTLMVVRAWHTKRKLVKDALDTVGKQNILGLVINDEIISSKEYSYYDYYNVKVPSSSGTSMRVSKRSRK